jgi:exonuclease III
MKILSWNVRGLGGLEKRKEVRGLIGEMQPWIVCIQETKLGS